MLFQIHAFGAEGMMEEMMRYLNAAESVLLTMRPNQKSDLYCIALNFLVKAKEVCVNNYIYSAIMQSPLKLQLCNHFWFCFKLTPEVQLIDMQQ